MISSSTERVPEAKTDAGKRLLKHWFRAKAARDFHVARLGRGAIEASLAAHKMAWIREIIEDIENER